MRKPATAGVGPRRLAALTGATALACVMAAALPGPAAAQLEDVAAEQLPADAEMLLEADTLVYDNDANTISAVGGVQIEYGGNTLVADRITYDRNTARLMAIGNVEIVERDGNRIFADEIDITDDFRDGFVNALRIETVDDTYFAAESAERRDGTLTTFNNGVYTACEPCEEKPGKPPIWQVKARKIIWNGETKIVRFEQARFEFFGLPIAYLPYFEIADPTVKRKSGFLIPSITGDDERGYGLRVPYYLALAPTYDLTLAVTGYTRQGFLGEAEWRQQFNSGYYSLKVAGIIQQNPDAWRAGRIDSANVNRGMVGSRGFFEINPRWHFGWDVLVQSDKNFSNTYDIEGFDERNRRSEVFLTGLNDRNYFDLRAMHFQVQEDVPASNRFATDEKQPWVLPSFDYAYIPDTPLAGGELSIDVHAQGLYRELQDVSPNPAVAPFTEVEGPGGASGRVTAQAEWKRRFVTPGGLSLTPILHARSDAIFTDYGPGTVNAINNFTINGTPVAADVRSSYYRYMATAGLEVRWPVLFSTASSTHVLEPMAQIFLRPDAPYGDTLGIPNEDAQSLVFDATTLFARDKFSGYDRIEGGTRANVGLRYVGSFANGWSANALFGQSYHLAGRNPFAQPDLVNVGAFSGLESDVSDFVGLVGVASPGGYSASLGARFDEQTFEMRRADVRAGYTSRPFSVYGQYAYIQAQPLYGFPNDRQEVTGRVRLRFRENWTTFGSATYDLQSSTLSSTAIGLGYDDECFIYTMTFSRTQNVVTDEVSNAFSFRVSLRTIGDFGSNANSVLDSFDD